MILLSVHQCDILIDGGDKIVIGQDKIVIGQVKHEKYKTLHQAKHILSFVIS